MIHLMSDPCPPEFLLEQLAVEAEIRAAFRGVTREGGISWSEATVIDDYGEEHERAAARLLDREASWESLVDDPSWRHDSHSGGFPFLDPIGFRYYIAAAMVRSVRGLDPEQTGYALSIDSQFNRNLVSLFTPEQARATARFVRFMIAFDDPIVCKTWTEAYRVYWRHFEPCPPSP